MEGHCSKNTLKPSNSSGKYTCIADEFDNIEQVTKALRRAGLESSNMIVGIDFTKSNEWTGEHSFDGQSLHMIRSTILNPYEQAISIIGRTLGVLDDDDLIPCFGFGDASTYDQHVFSFNPGGQPCHGLEEALTRYRQIVPHLHLSGPTSFAPIIEAAVDIVEQNGGRYHVLLIIADGQVTQSAATGLGLGTGLEQMSPQERTTIDAIVAASKYALSIVLVGVGDGPWKTMKQFDDNIPHRAFDNFQFVNFTQIMSKNMTPKDEVAFALAALMEIPTQFKATMELGILNRSAGKKKLNKVILPPPPGSLQNDSSISRVPQVTSSSLSSLKSSGSVLDNSSITAEQSCRVCMTRPRDMAFGCGHQTCKECGEKLKACPLCRKKIMTRIKLY